MEKVALVHKLRANAPRDRRGFLFIDFREHGPALTAIARSRHVSKAALVRMVLGEWLKAQSAEAVPIGAVGAAVDESAPLQKDAPFANVSLRMPAGRAARLASQARAAMLSRGMYVAQLLDAPSDDPLDASPRETLAALVRSNAELAAMYGDLLALASMLKHATSCKPEDLDVMVAGLSKELGQHLAFTAPKIAALPASWRRTARKPD